MQLRLVPLVFALGLACSTETAPAPAAAGALGEVQKTWPAAETAPAPKPAPKGTRNLSLRIINETAERQSQTVQKLTD